MMFLMIANGTTPIVGMNGTGNFQQLAMRINTAVWQMLVPRTITAVLFSVNGTSGITVRAQFMTALSIVTKVISVQTQKDPFALQLWLGSFNGMASSTIIGSNDGSAYTKHTRNTRRREAVSHYS